MDRLSVEPQEKPFPFSYREYLVMRELRHHLIASVFNPKGLLGVIVMLGAAVGSANAGTVTYYYTDPQGTPLATADAAGNILTTIDYRPYGQQILGTPQAGPGYTGHVSDSDSGFVYMQARYYDPVVGRFASVDPRRSKPGELAGFGVYSYANLNPVNNIDPDGRVAIVTKLKDGSVSVQFPTSFTGPEASNENIATFREQVAGLSGQYTVNGKSTAVNFSVTDIKKGLFGTPSAARNVVTLMKGPTTGDRGASFAEVGGNLATIRTDDRYSDGGVQHEVMHLGGLPDEYDKVTGKSIPGNTNIMNTVPGNLVSPEVEALINFKGNIHRDESK